MKFISSIVLFLAVTSLAAATLLKKEGTPQELKCADAIASTTVPVATEWSSTNVYPVRVCAKSEVNVSPCTTTPLLFDEVPEAKTSSVALNITLKGGKVVSVPPKNFDLADANSFCHTFQLCDFLSLLAGEDLEESLVSAEAVLIGQSKEKAAAKFNVIMQASSFPVVDKPVGNPVEKEVGAGVEPFSVICNNFQCSVTADNKPRETNQVLTVDGTTAPQCQTKEAGGKATKLYVSVFECAGTCPTTFTISEGGSSSSSTPSPSETGSSSEGSQTEGSQTETESSGALHITGMGSAFIATILAFIA